MSKFIVVIALLFLPSLASAQVVRADRITLNGGPCTERAGSGSPEGVQAGNPCDSWRDDTTGLVYQKVIGTSTTGWRRLVGATGATCTTFAGCVAATMDLDTLTFTQTLRTDSSFKFRQSVTEGGTRLESFNGGGWMPLRLSGGPTQVAGGGLHVGQSIVSDPGVGNTSLDGYIGTPNYASQTTGWRATAAGAADFRYLFTGEMHAKSFIADLEQALAGGQVIAKSVTTIGAAFTVPAAGAAATLVVQDLPSAADMAVFQSGDAVLVRTFSRAAGELTIADAWGVVTAYADLGAGLQQWTFTRPATNAGTLAASTVVPVDSIVIDYGVSGNGFYEVNAIDGLYGVNSPYAQIVTWAGNSPAAANQTVRTRLGNLLGITGDAEYGLLAGTYAATDGQYFKASDQGFEVHGLDMSLWDGATRVLNVDHSTPYWSMGTPAPTSYGSGTGCWQGMNLGDFKWRCGNPAGSEYIQWDGSTLTVAGSIRLPAASNPSGSGLFLGSDFMGYYASGAWKTYMDNAGGFYLGGVSGSLQWNGSALTVTGTLAGNGSAITSISGGNITTGSVTATQIAANAITATQLAADSVTSAKILAGTIVASDIAASTITGSNIAAGTIAAGNIVSGTITATQIAASTITAANMNVSNLASITATLGTITAGNLTLGSAGYVRQGQTAYNTGTGFWLGDDAGTPKFSIGNPSGNRLTFDGTTLTYVGVGSGLTSLDGGNVQSSTIPNAALAANTITAAKIAAGTITTTEIAANTITAADIAAGTITATEIAASTITAGKLNVTDLSAITANLGTITAGSVTLGSSGYVRQGQTAYNSGTGFWLGDVSGTAKFSIGNSSGNNLTWDGTTLRVNGTYVPAASSYSTLGNGGNTATTYTPTLFLTNGSAGNYDRICTNGNSGSGACSVSGDFTTGTEITVIVTGSGTVTVRHLESLGGSTLNGFICPGAADFTRATTESFKASYDGSRWVVTSKS